MSEPMIYGAIIDAMGQISAIGKDRKNQMQGFQYRGIDDVMNELHGVLAKSGIFIVPSVLEEQRMQGTTSKGGVIYYTRLKIKFTFYAKDGSSVESVVIGEAMDSGDKASNKALSIGLKYALLQVFCIPTEDDKDPDSVSYDFKEAGKAFDAPPQEKPKTYEKQEPSDYDKLKHLVENYEAELTGKGGKGNAFEQCCFALASNDPSEIRDKLERAVKYLAMKGINV